MARLSSLVAVVAMLSITAATILAAEAVRISGTIISIDREAGAIVLGEVGPWLVRDGETVLTRRTVTIADDTAFVRLERTAEAPSGFAGDFVERGLEPWAVRTGDFVTVEATAEGPRLVAVRIAVVAVSAR